MEHAIPFHAWSGDPDDFSDFDALRAVLGRRRIVLLGEHRHGDGAAFAVKSRLIRFLHRQLGFDVMAFEAGIFDCMAAWQAIRASPGDRGAMRAAFRAALPAIWSRCAQVETLMDDVASQASGPRPLELVGFDCQFGELARQHLSRDTGGFLVSSGLCTTAEWEASRPVVSALVEDDARRVTRSPEAPDRERFLALLRTAARSLCADPPDAAIRLWAHVLESVAAQAVNLWSPDQLGKSRHASYGQRREVAMARTLCWWAGEHYPTRRMIVWAHQGHLLRNLRDVPEWSDWHVAPNTAGEAVRNALPGDVYTIGFTSCSGRFGRVGSSPSPVRMPSDSSIEGAMWSTGYDAALLDFTSIPESATELRRCTCRLKGSREVVIEPHRHPRWVDHPARNGTGTGTQLTNCRA